MTYGGISDRIKSAIFDIVIIGILMFAASYVLELYGMYLIM